ncbi:MAG: energy-coupling factor transporter ATPase [Thermofilaceae archaeon]|nr:energy-coupling factor transporter ATPase [Thermofilaceae archaeon]MCX8181258.1 energy-coupling factor transporter ATPase [Thermofilaceae archaeon]MDW8003523.1 energy-coupling factor transporter ATPase [Thermofilaceae archaeon]
MSKAVVVKDVWWKYVGREDYALKGIELEIEKGELLAVMGHSGSGKTSLALTLTGIIPQRIPGEFKGAVEVFGMDTLSVDVTDIAKRVAVVFEDPEIQFVMSTVEDEIVISLEPLKLSREEIRERLEWSLELVGLPTSFLRRAPLQLSGGEKQRVAIAAAVARRPDLIILDEPTSDLDPVGKEEVMSALKRLRDELDTTILLIEHESEHVAEFADRVAVLKEGRVVLEGDPAFVFTQTQVLRSSGVSPPEVSELSSALGLPPLYRFEDAVEAFMRVVKEFKALDIDEEPHVGDTLIECKNVEFTYPGGVKALREASISVREGELIALVGPNGGGKTTLAKIMCGLLRPDRGEVRVLGRRVEDYDRLTLSSLVGYVYQNPDHQIFNKTVYEEIAFGLKLRKLPDDEIDRKVLHALELFGLRGLEREHPFFLSKGEKRRLALASVYVLDPKVLIVDEPTTGQDMGFNELLFKTLRDLTREGRAVIVITHSIPLASRYSDRLAVVKGGRVIANDSPRRVLVSPEADEWRLTKPQVLRLALRLGLNSGLTPLSVKELEKMIVLVAS